MHITLSRGMGGAQGASHVLWHAAGKDGVPEVR
jgi:hypothetical protein